MARSERVVIEYTDDITGKSIAADEIEVVTIELDGEKRRIETNAKDAKKIRDLFAPYADKGEKIKPEKITATVKKRVSGGRGSATVTGGGEHSAAKMRVWFEEQGIEVPARGRMPQNLREQYAAAHGIRVDDL